MSTPVLNNGIFVRDTKFSIASHIDSYHLTGMGAKEPTDLGIVDFWAQTQKVEMPLYQMSSFKGRNTVMVDNEKGMYTWRQPLASDLPYIIDDIETSQYPGLDGTNFKIWVNRRAFGSTSIISYDKMNGAEMFVVPGEPIIPRGSGWEYTVQLVNNDNTKFIDKMFLKPMTKLFRKGSARGEYGESFDDLAIEGPGFREYVNYVGGAEANKHYSISSKAAVTKVRDEVVELWKYDQQNPNDPSITDINAFIRTNPTIAKSLYDNGQLSMRWLPTLEARHISEISRDIESYLMWGHGGTVKQDGPDDIRLSMGLWKQLDSSYKRVYNKNNFNLDMFKAEIFNFFNGKVEFEGPDSRRKLVIQTGIGGMRLVNQAIAKEAVNSGLILNAKELGAITGSGMNLGFGYSYTSFHIPFLANVEFVLNPAFDNVFTNDIENPKIDGYNLSSYSFIIFDITENTNDNIYLLKYAPDPDLVWWIQEGTFPYMGVGRQGFKSSGNFNGYRVFMRQKYPAIWIKDPTKVLKIVMKNPITGGSY